MSKTIFTIEIEKKKNPVPNYMDMMIFRPRRSKKFKSAKEYTRKQKHKKSYDDMKKDWKEYSFQSFYFMLQFTFVQLLSYLTSW